MTAETSITLTDADEAFVRDLVAAGRNPSSGAVVHHALDLLRQRLESAEAEASAFRGLIAKRRRGRFISGEEMDVRLAAMIARKRQDSDVPTTNVRPAS